ncbi:MAG: hypothetical protein ACTTIC_06885 [Helicobacteraceae bacterium]
MKHAQGKTPHLLDLSLVKAQKIRQKASALTGLDPSRGQDLSTPRRFVPHTLQTSRQMPHKKVM